MYYNIEDKSGLSVRELLFYIGETTIYGKKNRQKSGQTRR